MHSCSNHSITELDARAAIDTEPNELKKARVAVGDPVCAAPPAAVMPKALCKR